MKYTEKKAPADTRMLELRIHGIRNTPPHELLRSGEVSLTPNDVELVSGDELAGFYRVRSGAVAAVAANGGSPRVVEAYSWGRLARFTGIGITGKVADAAVRTAWFLLMPFGLTNAAYWSRPLPIAKQPGYASGTADPLIDYADQPQPRGWDGAGRIRLFALALTLYFVVTAAVVSMDLIGVQCFPADIEGNEQAGVAEQTHQICSALPTFLDGLADVTRGQRIALFALIPLVAVGLIALIGYLARTRFHPRPTGAAGGLTGPDAAIQEVSVLPTLMIRNLWEARKEIRYNGWLHVWAALAATAAIIAWDGFWTRVQGADCGNLRTFIPDCLPRLTPDRIEPVGFVMLVVWLVAAGTMAAAGIETVRKSSDNPDLPRRAGSPLIVPIAVLAVASMATASLVSAFAGDYEAGNGGDERMLGLGMAPASLMLVLLALILSMCVLRRENYDRRMLGWAGRGPAVFSTLALGAATILSSATVGVTAALLQNNFERRSTTDDGMWRFGPTADNVLDPPLVFTLFSGLLLAVIILGAGAWGLSAVQAIRSMNWNTATGAIGDLEDFLNAPLPASNRDEAGRKLVAARRTASLAHRAEAGAALLASLIFLGLLTALVLGIARDWLNTSWWDGVYGFTGDMGALGLTVAGAAILALAVLSARPNSRPLALLWDIMCFMPKAAHPFGPPCYAERAVPEFAGRIAAWVDGDAAVGRPPGEGRVVISAHSLGAVIAVSALFHLRAMRPNFPFRKVGLMTYGTQLRAYFGRFFPELLGPAVLATTAVSRTGLRAPGGPDSERQPVDGPSGPDYLNLSGVLGPGDHRWVNLYRRTDYLGFPIMWRQLDTSEMYAQEIDPFTYQFLVVSHSDYLQAPQYDEAIAAVVNSLPGQEP